MARLARISPVDIPVHIVQRGNNRQVCFVADDDYKAYIEWLSEYSQKYGVDVHAWVLMTNHVHCLYTKTGQCRKFNDAGSGAWGVVTSAISITLTGVAEPCGKAATNPASYRKINI